MAGDTQPEPAGGQMSQDAEDPAATVRLAIGGVAEALGDFGLAMPGRVSAGQAAEALEVASRLLGSVAGRLAQLAADEETAADENGPDLLSPAIRRAFVEGCAPASASDLEKAVCDYRLARIVIPKIGAPLLNWDDPAAGASPPPAEVRADISRVLRAAQAFRQTMALASGEAIGLLGIAALESGQAGGGVAGIFDELGALISHAEAALEELCGNASRGRAIEPKTRLALQLGDFLASSGVPVIVDGKPSNQWALAYDLALEAAGEGACRHARKTLRNALALRMKERMPQSA